MPGPSNYSSPHYNNGNKFSSNNNSSHYHHHHNYNNDPAWNSNHNNTNGNGATNNASHGQAHLTPESREIARLRQKSISHPSQQCQLTIHVPSHTVGAVIGRGGRTILNVQREAMRRSAGHNGPVRISVLGGNNSPASPGAGGERDARNDKSDHRTDKHPLLQQPQLFPPPGTASASTWNYHEYYNSLSQQQQQQRERDSASPSNDDNKDNGSDWTPVTIRGDPVGCFAAVRQVLPLVDRSHDPNVVLEVPIHRAKHSLLLGKKGLTLAALSATFEVRIMVPPNGGLNASGNASATAYTPNNGDAGNNSNVNGKHFPHQHGHLHSYADGFYWNRHHSSNTKDAGSTMLFSEVSNQGHNDNNMGNANTMVMPNPVASAGAKTSLLSTNIIQLEGNIDKIEKCLVRVLGVVAGERWNPTGMIVKVRSAGNHGTSQIGIGSTNDFVGNITTGGGSNHGKSSNPPFSPKSITSRGKRGSDSGGDPRADTTKGANTPRRGGGGPPLSAVSGTEGADIPTTPSSSKKSKNTSGITNTKHNQNTNINSNSVGSGANNSSSSSNDNFQAEAIVTAKIGTSTSKLPSLGMVRQMQRKTNTIIRRKKAKPGVSDIGSSNGDAVGNEQDMGGEGEFEPSLVVDSSCGGDNTSEEGGKDDSEDGIFTCSKASTQYIITGKADNVRAAAIQLEKILGLDVGTFTLTVVGSSSSRGAGGSNRGADDDDNAGEMTTFSNDRPGTGTGYDHSHETSRAKIEDGAGNGASNGGKIRRRAPRKGGRGGRGDNARKNSKEGPPYAANSCGDATPGGIDNFKRKHNTTREQQKMK